MGGLAQEKSRLTRQVSDFFEEGGSGIAGDDVDASYAATCGFYFRAANDLIAGPVAAFDEDIGQESGDQVLGS
jgi:hypothetical protein